MVESVVQSSVFYFPFVMLNMTKTSLVSLFYTFQSRICITFNMMNQLRAGRKELKRCLSLNQFISGLTTIRQLLRGVKQLTLNDYALHVRGFGDLISQF